MAGIRLSRDVNMEAASALSDMALVHTERHGQMAYDRAATSILGLEQSLREVGEAGSLRAIPNIGPASERVILEVLADGTSATVERAVAGSAKAKRVAEARSLRTNFLSRAAVLEVLRARIPGAVKVEDYRGDLQMHTRWSDGRETISDMAEAAKRRGHRYAGLTDHSYGLRIARDMSMDEVERQHQAIDTWNRSSRDGFRLIKGVEANIRADGSVDLEPDEIRRFEIVLAAAHSLLGKPEDQTPRMVAAVRHPGVHVLAHPRGRKLSRQGVLARWKEVFEEAAKVQVAVEIDGDPHRQDLDYGLAQEALEAGCLFALDSDAHSGEELVYSEYSIAHARLAGIPAERIVNCWPIERLIDWAAARSAGRSRSPGRSSGSAQKVVGSAPRRRRAQPRVSTKPKR